MKIATWNVNSIKARLDRVLAWIDQAKPDVLALQETKCAAETFPLLPFVGRGYDCAAWGNGGREGVALLSQIPLEEIQLDLEQAPGFLNDGFGPNLPKQTRALSAKIAGIRVFSLYAPNGRKVGAPHYHYKLAWLEALTLQARELIGQGQPVVLMGDFNIIARPEDSNDPEHQLDSDLLCSAPEKRALEKLLAVGLEDLVRDHVPEGFTFWHYSQGKFNRDQGVRIDYIFGSKQIISQKAQIYRDERKKLLGLTPSDHVPVMAEIRLRPESFPEARSDQFAYR